MVKTPQFDEPRMRGATWSGRPRSAVELMQVLEGAIVDLVYKGKTTTVKVTKVLEPQQQFEGVIQEFEGRELEHEDLHHADVVRFAYTRIQHIHSTGEAT